jgi:hypothetical protein
MLARDKHSNLLPKSVNYGQKSFITLAPGGKVILRNWVLNEADTLNSSLILIYSTKEQSIYTQNVWHDATLIKR